MLIDGAAGYDQICSLEHDRFESRFTRVRPGRYLRKPHRGPQAHRRYRRTLVFRSRRPVLEDFVIGRSQTVRPVARSRQVISRTPGIETKTLSPWTTGAATRKSSERSSTGFCSRVNRRSHRISPCESKAAVVPATVQTAFRSLIVNWPENWRSAASRSRNNGREDVTVPFAGSNQAASTWTISSSILERIIAKSRPFQITGSVRTLCVGR